MTQKLYYSAFTDFAFDDDTNTPRHAYTVDVLLDGIISKVIHMIHITTAWTDKPSFGWSIAKHNDQYEIDPSTRMFEVMESLLTNETGFAYHVSDFPVGVFMFPTTDEGLVILQETCRYPVLSKDRLLYDLGLNPILDADNAFATAGVMSILSLIEQVVY